MSLVTPQAPEFMDKDRSALRPRPALIRALISAQRISSQRAPDARSNMRHITNQSTATWFSAFSSVLQEDVCQMWLFLQTALCVIMVLLLLFYSLCCLILLVYSPFRTEFISCHSMQLANYFWKKHWGCSLCWIIKPFLKSRPKMLKLSQKEQNWVRADSKKHTHGEEVAESTKTNHQKTELNTQMHILKWQPDKTQWETRACVFGGMRGTGSAGIWKKRPQWMNDISDIIDTAHRY